MKTSVLLTALSLGSPLVAGNAHVTHKARHVDARIARTGDALFSSATPDERAWAEAEVRAARSSRHISEDALRASARRRFLGKSRLTEDQLVFLGSYKFLEDRTAALNQKTADDIKKKFNDKSKDLEGQDKLGNFEINNLMSDYNQAETLASAVQKKLDDARRGNPYLGGGGSSPTKTPTPRR